MIAVLMAAMGAYALYRMTQRLAPSVQETGSFAAVAMQASPIAVEVAVEQAQEDLEIAAAEMQES